jgi:prepilin-type processing-associated H-X9-DG protein
MAIDNLLLTYSFFCGGYYPALEVMQAIRAEGLRIPGDVSITQPHSLHTLCPAWFYGPPRHFSGANFTYVDGHAKWARVNLTKESPVFWGWYRVRIHPTEP